MYPEINKIIVFLFTKQTKILTQNGLKKEIVFIVNPISGTHGKEFILHQVEKRLNHTLYDYTIRKTEYAGHATEIARQAAEDKRISLLPSVVTEQSTKLGGP